MFNNNEQRRCLDNRQFNNNFSNQNITQTKPQKKHRVLRFFKFYFIIVGIIASLYVLMRLIIELLVMLNAASFRLPY